MSEQQPSHRPDEPGSQPPQYGQGQPPQYARPGGAYPPPTGTPYPPGAPQYTQQYPQPPHPGYGRELSPADQRMWGMLAHISGLVTGLFALSFLGPLIIYLVHKDRGGFVRRQSAEALNFQILLNVIALATALLSVITLGIALVVVVPLWIVLGIAALVFMIVAAVKANNGEDYRYPLNWRVVR